MHIRKNALTLLIGVFLLTIIVPTITRAGDPPPGEFRLTNEPSLHEPGKVILLEFADFYCPHCHMFETVVIAKLKKEFQDKLEVRMVGFPVMRGKLPTAFEMYEQAKTMGKGSAMKAVLFRTIHQEQIHILDKSLRALLIQEVGLNVKEFEEGLASGNPYLALEKGKAWGERVGITHTPTVILDGNIRVDNLDINNLRTLIKGLLHHEQAG
ncbi:MAG: thioredoxin domain-containing protein [Nitrospirales bacterium]|nr:thioredoxin domain-containing protein [Nitrospirales bacterium]